MPAVVAIASLGAWYSWSQRTAEPETAPDLSNNRHKLIEFGMGVCAQCKRMRPIMNQATRELGATMDVHVLDVRNEKNERLAERYRMRVMPLVVLIDGSGRELWRHEGHIGFDELRAAVTEKLPEATPR